jgi:hypothetical protein
MLLLGCSQPIGVPKLFAQDLFDADNRVVDRLLDAEAPRHLARSTIATRVWSSAQKIRPI